ncbi:YjeF N-terminal domain-containing protein [Phyllosticta citricarpa]|uniref:Enhancer of mRNA-decapping protein 3 n=1 Tax=Phyllosticta citricarpa TaxID=55181 RepID=A0ABR1L5J4_9PEZI
MSATLIGINVLVTLKQPPNTVVQGIVANVVEQTATLVLQDVCFPASGHRLPSYTIAGVHIADISVHQPSLPPQTAPPPSYPPSNAPSFPPSIPPSAPAPAPQYARPSATPVEVPAPASKPKQNFVDPAILSVGKKPASGASTAHEVPSTPVKPVDAIPPPTLPRNNPHFPQPAKKPSVSAKTTKSKEDPATLTAPFDALGLESGSDSGDSTTNEGHKPKVSIDKTRTGKPMETPLKGDEGRRRKRGGRGGKKQREDQLFPPERDAAAPQLSPETQRKTPAHYKGKGWRQTPMLQDNSGAQQTPGLIGGKVGRDAVKASNKKSRRQKAMEATNGWATEDATDVQELPDFDFAENLSKFDKRSVFEQIRNEDTTADEERLVSFNRLQPRAGTAGGKNLHPTENVLEQRRTRRRGSSSSSSEEEFSDFDSGRNSRRNRSLASTKRVPFRSNSAIQEDIVSAHPSNLTKSLRSQGHRGSNAYSSTNSPVPGRPTPPSSPSLSLFPQLHPAKLRVISSGKSCATITPGTMTALEELAEVDYLITEEQLAENAGRGIAQVALSAVNPGGRRLARENLAINARPVVIVLAGNHRTGARAIAAARHLHARGPRVFVALLGCERPADYEKDVRRQVDIFRRFGGYVRSWSDLHRVLKRLEAPPELIVDALLGRNKEFDALGPQDKETALAIVGWANKSRASVLAIEAPSGINNSTGEVSILEGEPLEVRAKYIVCLGAPRTGLLRALQLGDGRDPEWLVWVVDLGLNKPWRRLGGPGKKGVKFGSDWAVAVRFDTGDAEVEEEVEVVGAR